MPMAPLRQRERVLHLSIRNEHEKQAPLTAAFQRIASTYRLVDSALGYTQAVDDQLIYDASQISPTLVWFQAQYRMAWMTDDIIVRLRSICARNAVFVNWDGDQHFEPRSAQREWFVWLGRQLDASLIKNTLYPYEYAKLGVVRPGYLGEGYNADLLSDLTPPVDCPEVAFIANQYPFPGYEHRVSVMDHLARRLGPRLGIYGGGWDEALWEASRRGRIAPPVAGGIYAGAKASLSLSIRDDLPRYTSNRMVNILAAGGVGLIEKFPEWEALDLEDGVNCLMWAGLDELDAAVDRALGMPEPERQAMRAAAKEAAKLRSWDAYMARLLAIVDLIRAEKGLPPC